MIRRCKRWLPAAAFAFGLMLCTAALAPVNARTSSRTTRNTTVSTYDISKEVRIQGTIEKIDGFGSNGPIGTHVLIETASGIVDAHLGFGFEASARSLGISVGQNVTIVGMMEAVGNSSVLMARILTTPTRVIVLRNEHGIPIRSMIHHSVRPGISYTANFGDADLAIYSSTAAERGGA